MCHAPLYQESNLYEYMAAPNQDGKRFGKHYHYNSYAMRSEEPDPNKIKILGLGDSVLAGGATIDQDDIATSIFNRETGWQMLNISAGSWGPDNCAAYLDAHGLFNAKAMFLLVSSHDAYDNMNFTPVVGVHETYPKKQFVSAWCELICRYIWPRTLGKYLKNRFVDPDQQVVNGVSIRKDGKIFNPGFDRLKSIADTAGIPLLICLHADIKELEERTYNESGKTIIAWCQANNITPILEIDEGITKDMYRDGIHTNEKGQRFEAELMKKYLLQTLTE